ncbi:hypothetical protein Tco_0759034 [Tanacetum coccineum]
MMSQCSSSLIFHQGEKSVVGHCRTFICVESLDSLTIVIKVEEGEQSVSQNESIDRIIAEEERGGTLQSVPVNGDKNQASTQDICAELKKQGDNLGVLKNWQEKDMDVESKIETVNAGILRLKAELREKELARENLVKQKSDLFDQSKMSIDEAEKLLQEMVAVKLQSDVAADNMNQLAAKWERIREKFMFQEQ